MIVEIAQAVEFLGRLLSARVDANTLNSFKQNLTNILHVRFDGHWDTQRPYAGNGYRALSSFNDVLDPVLIEAAKLSKLSPTTLYSCIPRDFVLWIDPYTVSYRVGDHGNIMTLFEDRSRGRITFRLDANSPAVTSIHEIVDLRSPTSPPLLAQVSQQLQPQQEVPLFQFLAARAPVRISPPPSPEGKKGCGQLVMAN
ncbi:hypothetical protein BC937DRAFT_89099 [Endogone sp. FLAS-F59071]|nr:hypothetical protein BC937DRAFT_89099 [Endogone sp. FLAS-F59071]|eukprot:RUS18153.1 hypothetical protein BC937DRAFT_89099 [Endogone sp. FLAS-F59071]